MEKINTITSDGVSLAGLWYEGGSSRSVILLHMMPATKESWQDLALRLVSRKINVLAIDLRGHGESEGGDYKAFTPEDHQLYIKDTEAAYAFIAGKFPGGKIMIGGASIGANIAIQAMVAHPEIKKGFVLSAGLDYQGVNAEALVQQLSADQNILLVAACDDVRSNGLTCDTQADDLYTKATCQKERITYEHGGHGTDMFASHGELMDTLADFLTEA